MKQFCVVMLLICLAAVAAMAQEGNVAIGVSTTMSPGPSQAVMNSGTYYAPTIGGGSYINFSGDFLIKKNFGVGGEVAWRASQNLYQGYQPYRPFYYDFYGVYAPKFGKYFGVEALAGIGAESVRFYTNYYNCSYFGGCTNYVSSNHFMGVFGGGLKFYPTGGNWFIRPEVRVYTVRNNEEFSSGRVVRSGVSIGYTFGGSNY